MSWLDLHLHSHYSDDGEFSPEALMDRCLKTGVRTAALADHNTAAGVLRAQRQAALTGVTLIPGIELDCDFGEVHLHVLGYFIDPGYSPFQVIEQGILEQEQQAAPERKRSQGLDI